MRPTDGGAFILPSNGRFAGHPTFCRRACETVRHPAIKPVALRSVAFAAEMHGEWSADRHPIGNLSDPHRPAHSSDDG